MFSQVKSNSSFLGFRTLHTGTWVVRASSSCPGSSQQSGLLVCLFLKCWVIHLLIFLLQKEWKESYGICGIGLFRAKSVSSSYSRAHTPCWGVGPAKIGVPPNQTPELRWCRCLQHHCLLGWGLGHTIPEAWQISGIHSQTISSSPKLSQNCLLYFWLSKHFLPQAFLGTLLSVSLNNTVLYPGAPASVPKSSASSLFMEFLAIPPSGPSELLSHCRTLPTRPHSLNPAGTTPASCLSCFPSSAGWLSEGSLLNIPVKYVYRIQISNGFLWSGTDPPAWLQESLGRIF